MHLGNAHFDRLRTGLALVQFQFQRGSLVGGTGLHQRFDADPQRRRNGSEQAQSRFAFAVLYLAQKGGGAVDPFPQDGQGHTLAGASVANPGSQGR